MSETLQVTGTMHLIARHAASALWLARYIERIENLARLLDVTKTFTHDDSDWLTILRINGDAVGFQKRYPEVSQDNVARFYLLDADNPSSVQAAIAAAKENARTLRALISTEMWLQINVFHGRIRALSGADLAPDRLSAVCAMLKEGAQAHVGISEGTFYRDQCWHFTMIGRYLERADQTTRLLDTRFNALVPRVGCRRSGYRCRQVARAAARRRRLSRLPPRAPARLPPGRGGGLPAGQHRVPARGGAEPVADRMAPDAASPALSLARRRAGVGAAGQSVRRR